MKIPKAHRITARQVDEVSFGRRLRRTRERLLQKDQYKDAKTGLESISNPEASLTTATTVEQIDAAVKARAPVIKELRRFNQDPVLNKLRRTSRHRTKRSWSRLTSDLRSKAANHTIQSLTPEERGVASVDPTTGFCTRCRKHEIGKQGHAFHHPAQCMKTTPVVRPVAFTGAAGSGVGSRLQGHFRLGGGRIREQHRQYGVVVITDEHMTSQTCNFCFSKTRPARSRRIVDGKQKVVSLGGAKECTNPVCPAFKVGYTTRPRDTQACVCIGAAGFSALDLDDCVAPHKEPPDDSLGEMEKQGQGQGEGQSRIQHEQGQGQGQNKIQHEKDEVREDVMEVQDQVMDQPEQGAAMGVDPVQLVRGPREPIRPFRSFLRPHEHQPQPLEPAPVANSQDSDQW